MKRYLFVAVVLAVVMAGCGVAEGERDAASGSEAVASQEEGPKGTFDLPNGRSLHMECLGSGSPTIVLETGEGTPGIDMFGLQDSLAERSLTCAYDRANVGQSGDAPMPRSAGDVVEDLHELLAAADVPGPYVLVGHSNGGSFVQSYARLYPDEVVGVVAMNPVPPSDPWLERVQPLLNPEEREGEQAYFRGENAERIDWIASDRELKNAPPPPSVPFELLFSNEAECEGGDPFCLKTHDLYEEVEREVAQEWPEGSHSELGLHHNMYLDKPGLVIEAVERVASK